MLPLVLLLQAAPPPPAHHASFEAAFRTGLSVPAGELEAGVPMREVAGLQVPIFLELGARVSRRVFLGAYGAVGVGSTSSTYDQLYCMSSECAARSAHVGAEVHVHVLPYKLADPWIGAGFGYEWFFTTGSPKTSMNGFEALRPMLGVDFRLGPKAALGLFVDAPLSLYTHWDPPETSAGRVPGSTTPRVHTWVTFGIRLVLSRAPGS